MKCTIVFWMGANQAMNEYKASARLHKVSGLTHEQDYEMTTEKIEELLSKGIYVAFHPVKEDETIRCFLDTRRFSQR